MSVRSLWSLAVLSLAVAFGFAPDARAHSGTLVEGTLYNVHGDQNPRTGNQAVREYYVHSSDDGHFVPVDLSAAEIPVGGIAMAVKKHVRVTAAATAASAQAAAQPNGKMKATKLEVIGASADVQADVFPVIGSRKYMSLLCKFGGAAGEPRVPGFFSTQLGNSYPGFNHYFQEASYGQANINGSSASANWMSMAHARSFFNIASSNASDYLFPMAQECVNAAEAAGTDFTGVVGINFMFNDLVDDCCAWGGSGPLVLDGVTRGVSITWMPYWGYYTLANYGYEDTFGWLEHGVLAHELSHSFASPHSNDPSGYQYGNYWDVVSKPGGTCAVVDATYGCVGQHQVAQNKLIMGFIPAARIASQATGAAAATYNIERMATPPNAGGTYQVLKVLTPNAHKYYTVESRLRTSYDQNLPGDGVLIHEVVDNRTQPCPPVSASSPCDPARLLRPDGLIGTFGQANIGGIAAKWSVGQTYINATDNVKITVMAFDGATGTAQIKAEPATAPGEYSFALAGYTVVEGGPAINIAVTRTAPFGTAGSVHWATSNGTAIAGSDFGTTGSAVQRSGNLTWLAGTGGTKNITVGLATSNIPVMNEGAAEADETFSITLSSPVGGVLGAQSSTTVTVQDGSVIQFGDSTASVNENGPNITVAVTRSGNTSLTQVVNYSIVNGTAMAGSDFGTLGSTLAVTGSVSFAPGETTKNITVGPTVAAAPYVKVIDDAAIEGPETFTLRLTSATNGAILGTNRDNVVTITSNENGVSMVATTRAVVEGAGAVEIFANRSGGTGAVDVNFSFGGGTALNNTHYQGVNGSLHWNNGETGQKSILVNILDDSIVNTARTFVVTLSGATGATLAAPMATTVTIADNDSNVAFANATTAVAETTANLVIPVNRTGTVTGAASVHWSTADGTAVAGTDFGTNGNTTQRSGTLNWAAGSAAAQSITIPIIPNGILNGARTFTVSLDSPTGADIGTISTITVTLNDDERGVKFDSASYIVNEGTSTAIKVKRMGPTTTAMTATWATVNGTALSGTDFGTAGMTTPRTGSLSWGIGDATDKTIIIPALQTIGNQADRSFNVVLTPGAGITLGAPGTTTVTIQDDDIPAESNVRFDVPKLVVVENVGTAVLTLHRELAAGPTASFARDVTVKYATVAGTALATSDYLAVTNGTVHWTAGDSADKTINITIVNNAVAEPTESFKVVLSAPSAGLGFANPSDAEATISILDDDEAFPLDGVIPAGFSQAVGTTKSWHVSNDPGAYEGAFTLKSDEIDDGQTAGVEMNGTFAAGTITFKVKVSSEPNFDELRFFIDDVLQQKWSGTAVAGWQSVSFPISAGVHSLSWVYVKDGSVSVGTDAAYIDGLTTPSFTP